MLRCPKCKSNWDEVGNEYTRKNSDRLDYYCRCCQSKAKPEEKHKHWMEYEAELNDKPTLESRDVSGYTFEEKYPGLKAMPTCKDPMGLIAKKVLASVLNDLPTDLNELIAPVGSRVLVIPDVHAPFMHKKAVSLLKKIYDKYNCNTVVCLGDEFDFHQSSFHQSDADAHGATEELELAVKQLSQLAEAFSEVKVCYGNHSEIPKRQAQAVGLSNRLIKSNKDILLELGAPVEKWDFADHFIIDGVKYCHGTGRQAKARMLQDGISIVQGHYHSKSYIEYLANDFQLNFAMQLGALIDDEAYAFNYGKHFAKSHKNCGVVIDGVPTIEYMEL